MAQKKLQTVMCEWHCDTTYFGVCMYHVPSYFGKSKFGVIKTYLVQ